MFIWVYACACTCYTEDQYTHSTSKMRAFLEGEDISVGPHEGLFKG